jgi:hypothetical protein
MENHYGCRVNEPTASENSMKFIDFSQHILLFGKILRAFSTKCDIERFTWPRVMNSGIVIMKKIGQPACLLPKSAMIGYGRASETERIWVNLDGLINRSLLKIQSSPFGNLWESECLLKLNLLQLHFYFYIFKKLEKYIFIKKIYFNINSTFILDCEN